MSRAPRAWPVRWLPRLTSAASRSQTNGRNNFLPSAEFEGRGRKKPNEESDRFLALHDFGKPATPGPPPGDLASMAKHRNDDQFKNLFRLKDFFQAVPIAWGRASKGAACEADALQTLLQAFDAYGRRPALDEIEAVASGVGEYGLLAGLAVMFAIRRWYPEVHRAQGIGLMVGMWAGVGADSDPGRTVGMRLHIFRLGLELAAAMPDSPTATLARRELSLQLGCSLAPDDDPVKASEGRRYLAAHVREVRAALEAVEHEVGAERLRMALRLDLGRGLANLGQALETWAERHDCDDPRARLEEALVLHEEAFTIPERVADPSEPVGLYHSLKMRGVCRRHLARLATENPGRRLELLDGAVSDARAALDLARHYPGRLRGGDAVAVNVVNALSNRLNLKLDLGLVSPLAATLELAEIETLACDVHASPNVRAPTLAVSMETGLRSLRARLGQGNANTSSAQLQRSLEAALGSLRDSRAISIEHAAARGVIQDLEASGEAALSAPLMHLLSGFLGYLDIGVIGPELSARALRQEEQVLQRESGAVRDGWDPVKHVEDGLKGFALQLCDWGWSHAERRTAAGFVRTLVSARLGWASTGARPIDVLEELRLADLQGSVAWRSDISFFGQGPWRAVPGPRRTEEDWRCYIFRTRWERDSEAEFLQTRELREMMMRLTGHPVSHEQFEGLGGGKSTIYPVGTSRGRIRSETDMPEDLWLNTPDGIVVPCPITEGSARAASTRLLAELREAWVAGLKNGWAPAEVPDIPQTYPAELGRWLLGNPDAAILITGAGLTPSIVGHDGSKVWIERVNGPESVGAAINEYEEARDEHSFGNPDRASWVMAPGLSEAERDRRHRSALATPEATTRLDAALTALLGALGEAFGPALQQAKARGVRRLIILPRQWGRHVPWYAVPVGDGLLGETFATAVVETLAPIARSKARKGHSALYVGGKAGAGSSLALGKAVLTPLSDRTAGPTSRDEFEALAANARVLRVFAHGTPMLLRTETAGIEMNEDDKRPVNRYTVSEARTLDLRGVRRVELWACESGRGDAMYTELLHHDEPGGMDAAVLLAGAECVVASLWTQYVLASAMIAEAFTLELAGRPQPEAEALAAAVRRYREGMANGGVFAEAVAKHISTGPRPVHVETALRAGLDAWRDEAWSQLLSRGAAPLPESIALDGLRLGPSRSERRSVVGAEGDLVDQILGAYRSPLAWAGWRVTLRSKEAFDPTAAGET